MRARHFLISGRVQGVYYRLSTCKRAQALGVTGWVRNLTDGRVEILATGTERALEELERWLWQGPQRAQVEAVDSRSLLAETFPDFGAWETAEMPLAQGIE